MYAVIKTGGKQYRVEKDDVIRVEKLEAEIGDQVQFESVLMLNDGENVTVGTPIIDGCSVIAAVTDQARAKKIEIVKFRRRKHHQKRTGHRQYYTEIKILNMGMGLTADVDGSAKTPAPKAKSDEQSVSEKTATAVSTTDAPQFLSAPQGEPDDLKKLKGVGPVLEGKLHGLGIYHFHQVAAFTADDIAMIDQHLNFKGRIERDGWVEQAKSFIEE
jgi:large subunit ribosomal protein L21